MGRCCLLAYCWFFLLLSAFCASDYGTGIFFFANFVQLLHSVSMWFVWVAFIFPFSRNEQTIFITLIALLDQCTRHIHTLKTYPFSRFQRATRSHSQITASLDEHFLGLSFFHWNQTKLKVIHFIIFFSSFICFQLLKFLLFSVLILGIVGCLVFFLSVGFSITTKIKLTLVQWIFGVKWMLTQLTKIIFSTEWRYYQQLSSFIWNERNI